MNIQSTNTKNFNFLGRKRINQKAELFQAFLRERIDGTAIVEVSYDTKKIYKNVSLDIDSNTQLIIDIFVLGKATRKILPKKDFKVSEFITLTDVPDGAIPQLRIKIISEASENLGRIFAATSKLIKFKSTISGEEEVGSKSDKSILDFTQSDDLNGLLIKVVWGLNAEISIQVDRDFYTKYMNNPSLLRLVLYPDMIRSIAINLLSHFEELPELDDTCTAYNWLRFIEDKLELPLQGEDSIYIPSDADSLANSVDAIVEKFMGTPWHAGKTLLEEALNGS